MIEQKITPEFMMQNFRIVVDEPECGFCNWSYLIKFIQDGSLNQNMEASVSDLYESPKNYFHIGNPALIYVPENLRGCGYGSQLLFCARAYAAKYGGNTNLIFIIEASTEESTGKSNINQLSQFLLKNGIEVEAKTPPSHRGAEVEEPPYFEVSEQRVSENPNYLYWLDYWGNTISK